MVTASACSNVSCFASMLCCHGYHLRASYFFAASAKRITCSATHCGICLVPFAYLHSADVVIGLPVSGRINWAASFARVVLNTLVRSSFRSTGLMYERVGARGALISCTVSPSLFILSPWFWPIFSRFLVEARVAPPSLIVVCEQ
jgi:hypothetical protein